LRGTRVFFWRESRGTDEEQAAELYRQNQTAIDLVVADMRRLEMAGKKKFTESTKNKLNCKRNFRRRVS